jgi:hypothetical protein
MKIKDAQAALILRNAVVTELSLKNHLAVHGRFNADTHTIDMDYDVVEVDDGREDSYNAKLELITKVIVKHNRTTALSLKIKHLGLLAAPKTAFATTEDFVKAVELNGLASLVSFARANIASITGVTFCQGNIILPMINIFKLQQLKEESRP